MVPTPGPLFVEWAAPLTFALLALGTSAFVATLTRHIQPQPEYPDAMVTVMRWLGGAIAVAGFVLGLVMVGYTVVALL